MSYVTPEAEHGYASSAPSPKEEYQNSIKTQRLTKTTKKAPGNRQVIVSDIPHCVNYASPMALRGKCVNEPWLNIGILNADLNLN